jgi:hypothetical protein
MAISLQFMGGITDYIKINIQQVTYHIFDLKKNNDAAVSSPGDQVQPCNIESSKPSILEQCKPLHAAMV